MKVSLAIVSTFVLVGSVFGGTAATAAAPGLLARDACQKQVIALVNGMQNMAPNTTILSLELDSAARNRTYSLALDVDGCIDAYTIELSNHPAARCDLRKVELTQSCG